MECSMQDATFCNARYRTMEISGMLPVINSTYEAKLHEEKEQLVTLFIWISILAAVLLVALVYIYHQMKRLSLARKTMDDMNKELKHINGDLQELNARLQESNRVKEEYIGYVFNMCSVYIDKQEEFRKMLAKESEGRAAGRPGENHPLHHLCHRRVERILPYVRQRLPETLS